MAMAFYILCTLMLKDKKSHVIPLDLYKLENLLKVFLLIARSIDFRFQDRKRFIIATKWLIIIANHSQIAIGDDIVILISRRRIQFCDKSVCALGDAWALAYRNVQVEYTIKRIPRLESSKSFSVCSSRQARNSL